MLFLVIVKTVSANPGLPVLSTWTEDYARSNGPELSARAAFLMDAETGAVLFEKNADLVIPPASLTKLVAMHVAFEAVARGDIGLDDRVRPPVDAWARNMALGSSLMFLGPDQTVTVDELLIGLAVSSGNDAAVALARHVAGSIADFAEMMNRSVREIGLPSAFFVEPSGLSAENLVTAREFAAFVRIYLSRWPQTPARYHSVGEFTFPHSGSYPDGRVNVGAITQYNRNSLLQDYPGVDGLKTGFIRQSQYNLAVTAVRDGRRLIAVILGAPGEHHPAGERNRSRDAAALLDFGFGHFRNIRLDLPEPSPVRVWGGVQRYLNPVVDAPEILTVAATDVPLIGGEIVQEFEVDAPVPVGFVLGSVRITAGETVLLELPVTAGLPAERGRFVRVVWDRILRFIQRLLRR